MASVKRPRARTNSVNTADPSSEFKVMQAVTPPKTLLKKLSGVFKPDLWSTAVMKADSEFDETLVEIATREGEKYLQEDIHLEDESYKDRPLYKEAIVNKDKFIDMLISVSLLHGLTNKDGERLVDDTIISMVKRFLEINIRVCLDRRSPEYLLLMAASPCTRDWIIHQRNPHPNINFTHMLNESIAAQDIDGFKGALMFGLGYACELGAILSNGIDIINFDSFIWSSPDLKTVLQKQEIPLNLKSTELIQKRYPSCATFFQNSKIRNILKNSDAPIYNRMRKLQGGTRKRKNRGNRTRK